MSAPPQVSLPTQSPVPEQLLRRLLSLVPSDGSQEPVSDTSPFDGAKLADVPVSSDDDVRAAYSLARDAQRRWARTPVSQRRRIMLDFHDRVLSRRDEVLDLVQLETGKARKDALEEVLDVLITARHYARDAARLLKSKRHQGVFPLLTGVQEHFHPKGVVSIIAPWNYPLTLAASDAIPALLAGNAVVLKPDSKTPLSALWVADVLREAGMPDGLFQVVVGEGPRIGAVMLDLGDYLMFTGSTATGRLLAKQCGERLMSSSMELGGKNAIIICEDADLDRGAEIAVRACFSNSGQLCISTERMLIHDSVYDDFLERFLERVRGMRMVPRVAWGATMGSLISAEQLATVQDHVNDAVSKGAKVLAGGRARPDIGPFYFEPTVLAEVTESMKLCRQETFGPVVSVSRFFTIEEAIATVNDTEYGLNAAIISRDTKRAGEIAKQIRCGTVNINEGYAAAWGSVRSTMGGMGASGMGRRHGDEGLLKYTEAQTVATQRALGFGPQFGMSDEKWGKFLSAFIGSAKKMGMK